VPAATTAGSLVGHQSQQPQQTINAGHDAPMWIRETGALPSYDQVAAHGYSCVQQLLTALLELETVVGCHACGTYRLESLKTTTLLSINMEGNILRRCVTSSYNTNTTCDVTIND
jgi:hypothetical protein